MIKPSDIVVMDDLFDTPLIKEIEKTLLTRCPWTFTEFAVKSKDAPLHWLTELSMEVPFVQVIQKGFHSRLSKFGSFDLYRVYCNAHVPSDCPLPHVDSHRPSDRTVLYYANSKWDASYAGETVFYDKGEIVKSVLPKPGRVVIFRSDILHCARVPTKLLNGLRLTVAYKYAKK